MTEIEIASSPAHVRQVVCEYHCHCARLWSSYLTDERHQFLDFAKFPEWSTGPIKSVTPYATKSIVEKGDRLKVSLGGATFSGLVLVSFHVLCLDALSVLMLTSRVQENTEREFKWRGSLPYIFSGDHSFRFEPSEKTPGSTTFKNSEEFFGLAVFLLKPFVTQRMMAQGEENFNHFNRDLKKRVESLT